MWLANQIAVAGEWHTRMPAPRFRSLERFQISPFPSNVNAYFFLGYFDTYNIHITITRHLRSTAINLYALETRRPMQWALALASNLYS